MSTWIYSTDTRGQITSARKRLDDAAGTPFAPGWGASSCWNVVAEIETKGDAWDAPGGTQAMNPRPAYLRRSWLWGEDLSGTMTGAGGVGGLLAVTRHARGGSAAETYWALSDLNGNVTGLVSASSARVAVYEYDAFGRLLRENEPEPGLNPVRFSSKYQDVETGLVYYGFRYLQPRTRQVDQQGPHRGRWRHQPLRDGWE